MVIKISGKISAIPTPCDHPMTNVLMFGHCFIPPKLTYFNLNCENIYSQSKGNKSMQRMIVPRRDWKLESHCSNLLTYSIYRKLSHAVFGGVQDFFNDILIRLPGSPMMTPNKGSAKIRGLKFENVLGSQKGCKMMQSYLSFRFCLRSDHLPFFATQLWCGDASRLNQGQGLGTRCIGVPLRLAKDAKYAGVSSWLLGLAENKLRKKKPCRWVKQQKFPEVHDVG